MNKKERRTTLLHIYLNNRKNKKKENYLFPVLFHIWML